MSTPLISLLFTFLSSFSCHNLNMTPWFITVPHCCVFGFFLRLVCPALPVYLDCPFFYCPIGIIWRLFYLNNLARTWQRTQLKTTRTTFCSAFDTVYQLLWRGVVMFNVTFNNSSVIPWQLAILVEETGESHPPAESHWHTLSHKCWIEYTSPCDDKHWLHR